MADGQNGSVLELRLRVMTVKKDREDCEARAKALAKLELELRDELQTVCDHATFVAVRGDASFSHSGEGVWRVNRISAPLHLCCGCGLSESAIITPDGQDRLRHDLLMSGLNASELIERVSAFSLITGQPSKRIYRDVFDAYLQRADVRDPLILGAVLLHQATVSPLNTRIL